MHLHIHIPKVILLGVAGDLYLSESFNCFGVVSDEFEDFRFLDERLKD